MGIEESLPAGIALASMEKILGLARKHSQWPVTMGLACCAIEMMAAGTPRFDMSRFGLEVFRASPRHSDLMIVSGRVSHKMAPIVRRVYGMRPHCSRRCVPSRLPASSRGPDSRNPDTA